MVVIISISLNNFLVFLWMCRAQVVGWPPVRSFRKNNMLAFVKVSMDGAPYLRKVDLKMYKSYKQLSDALAAMFGSFTTIGKAHIIKQNFMRIILKRKLFTHQFVINNCCLRIFFQDVTLTRFL